MVKSICLFCSLGCELNFTAAGEYQGGPLCPRGHYNFELLNHPARLMEPQIGSRKVSWEEAIAFLGRKLKGQSPDAIGILVSALSSNEDAYLAAKFAKLLGTKNITVATDAADQEAYQGSLWEVPGAALAQLEDIENSEVLIIIGDILTRSPVLAKRLHKVKYGKRSNKIIVIDPCDTHTSWFATTHLKIPPGTEAKLLAELVQNSHHAASGTVIFAPSASIQRNDLVAYLSRVLAAAAGKKQIAFYSGGNTLGANKIIDQLVPGHYSYEEMTHRILTGKIHALLMLGEDFLAGRPASKKISLIAGTDYFTGEPAHHASLLLPAASHLENFISVCLATGQVAQVTAVAPQVGGKSNWEVLARLMNTTVEQEQISRAAVELIGRPTPGQTVNLPDKLNEASQLISCETMVPPAVTHFGNNNLVRNFFWYKVNNPSTRLRVRNNG